MSKLAVVLFLVLIVGDRMGSLTGTPIPVSQSEAEQNQIKVQLTDLEESVKNISESFKEQLGRIESRQAAEDSQLAAIKDIVTGIKTLLEPKKVMLMPPSPPNFDNMNIHEVWKPIG